MPALRATFSCALSNVFLRSVHHDPALRAIAFETNFLIPFQAASAPTRSKSASANHSLALPASVIGAPVQ